MRYGSDYRSSGIWNRHGGDYDTGVDGERAGWDPGNMEVVRRGRGRGGEERGRTRNRDWMQRAHAWGDEGRGGQQDRGMRSGGGAGGGRGYARDYAQRTGGYEGPRGGGMMNLGTGRTRGAQGFQGGTRGLGDFHRGGVSGAGMNRGGMSRGGHGDAYGGRGYGRDYMDACSGRRR